MRLLAHFRFALASALFVATPASAIEYRSVAQAAILFETPSSQGKKLYIVSPGTPVEVVVELDQWTKVRDPGGAITWIARSSLTRERTVMVTAASAQVRERPETDARVIFEVAKDVVLVLEAPPAQGWVHVRHSDGGTGYIRITEVWGI